MLYNIDNTKKTNHLLQTKNHLFLQIKIHTNRIRKIKFPQNKTSSYDVQFSRGKLENIPCLPGFPQRTHQLSSVCRLCVVSHKGRKPWKLSCFNIISSEKSVCETSACTRREKSLISDGAESFRSVCVCTILRSIMVVCFSQAQKDDSVLDTEKDARLKLAILYVYVRLLNELYITVVSMLYWSWQL